MKLRTEQIVNFLDSGIVSKRLPTQISYAIHVNVEAFKPIFTAYSAKKTEMLDKYAEKDEAGNPVIIDNQYKIENPQDWNSEMRELLLAEIEVNVSTISEEILDKCDLPKFDSLSAAEFSAISFMISQ